MVRERAFGSTRYLSLRPDSTESESPMRRHVRRRPSHRQHSALKTRPEVGREDRADARGRGEYTITNPSNEIIDAIAQPTRRERHPKRDHSPHTPEALECVDDSVRTGEKLSVISFCYNAIYARCQLFARD